MNALFCVDKPRGLTSHDVVARLRRAAGQRRVGHGGTLDPLATGVLLVALGRATRLLEFAARHDKSYQAGVFLGVTSDTDDTEGTLSEAVDVSGLPEEQLRAALRGLLGTRPQVPPAYSAIKLSGQPAYRLAREGRAPEMEPRVVEVRRLELLRWRPPLACVAVDCGPGVYVRSLARELGEALGCGGHLSSLRRTRSGDFRIEEAVALDELCGALVEDRWQPYDLPLWRALADLPRITLDEADCARLRQGQAVEVQDSRLKVQSPKRDKEPETRGQKPETPPEAAALSQAGEVVAIIRPGDRPGIWRPRKVLG